MAPSKNLRSVRISSYKGTFWRLYGFMILSGSIEYDKQWGNQKLRTVRISSFTEIFLRLYGFMLLSGSIESDNHNGAIVKFEKRSDK